MPTQKYPSYDVMKLNKLTDEDVADFERLLRQMTTPIPLAQIKMNIERALSSSANVIFIIRDSSGRIQATATVNLCPIPVRTKAWIDDVATDEAFRGKGFAKRLIQAAEEWAAAQGAVTINLTSNPHRIEARSYYEQAGYYLLDTGVFRKDIIDS